MTLIDSATGAAVVGAEDLALDARGERLLVSAYDRRAVEKAVRRKALVVEEGGIYAVALADLESTTGEAKATPLIEPSTIPGGLRPHGITLDGERGEIVFVNRAYQKIDGEWRLQATIERAVLTADSARSESVRSVREATTACAANSVTVWNEGALVSFDRPVCGWRAVFHDAQGQPRSGVMDATGRTMFTEARFANGVVALGSGDIALADTRRRAVLIARDDGAGGFREVEMIKTPGGPDNLKLSDDGSIIAALHPSMVRIALHRTIGVGRAPSRIVRISPDTGEVDYLLDDPDGKLFAAATVAVLHRGILIAGSALDAGLLVCRSHDQAPRARPTSPS